MVIELFQLQLSQYTFQIDTRRWKEVLLKDPKGIPTSMTTRFVSVGSALLAMALVSGPVLAQSKKGGKAAAPAAAAPAPQKQDEEYTKLIKEYLQDPRITTELVDHMPASDTVPSPLKFFGRIPGKPGELTYAHDIQRYYEALAKASPRAKFWKMGTTEEGRDIVVLAIADEATIKDLDKYKEMAGKLGDPRKITPEQAKELFHTAKPIYWMNSGIHSPETGGPECLIELAYRLLIEETPLIQNIRNNVITLITPVLEVDGRERVVDAYYYGKNHPGVSRNNLMMYWRSDRRRRARIGGLPVQGTGTVYLVGCGVLLRPRTARGRPHRPACFAPVSRHHRCIGQRKVVAPPRWAPAGPSTRGVARQRSLDIPASTAG
jgi:hypothetical protein